ncbi:MAG: HypC/HybG/HupF family hydrogenase formation chaperone, partial [Myxococcota bacterium]
MEIADAEKRLGLVEIAGVRRLTNLACVIDEAHPLESCVGDWVLVHVGFAMSRIDEEEAKRTLAILEEMGEVMELQDQLAAGDAARRGAGPAGGGLAPMQGMPRAPAPSDGG